MSVLNEIRRAAMDALARREHSNWELQYKLGEKGFSASEVHKVLTTLREEGLLSDERFAESYLRSRVNRGNGPLRIEQELQQRGVDKDTVRQVMEMHAPDWYQLAREVKNKRFGGALPDTQQERFRQLRFLNYRGFTSEQAREAVLCSNCKD